MFVQQHNFGEQSVVRCGYTNGVHNSGDHIHQFCEMEMVLDGEIEITVEGKRHIARQGDIAVIPPFKIHSFYTPEYVKQTIFVISNNFLPESIPYSELCRSRDAYVFHAPKPLWDYLISVGFHEKVGNVYDPIEERDIIHRIRATFYLIFAEYFNTIPAVEGKSSEGALSRMLLYMTEHFTEDLNQERLGEALGYSPKYVSNCFAPLSSIGFRGILNSMRVEYAKHLLVSTRGSNVNVALECGFSSVSRFHQVFREMVGISPKEYRRKNARTRIK